MLLTEQPRPAVFLDANGTLDDSAPSDGDLRRIALLPGVLLGALALSSAGYRLVVVSNKPAVAPGLSRRKSLAKVEQRMREWFAAVGVPIDGFYWCRHKPAGRGVARCKCRKPQPGLLLSAAHTHGIDLARSWIIGDILDDVEAGHRAGCRSILVDRGNEICWLRGEHRTPDAIVERFDDAVHVILDSESQAQALRFAAVQTVH
jgi:histidinol-phosphate phosphatase family protein